MTLSISIWKGKLQTVIYASEIPAAINHLNKCKNWHFKSPVPWMCIHCKQPDRIPKIRIEKRLKNNKIRRKKLGNGRDAQNQPTMAIIITIIIRNSEFRILSFGRMELCEYVIDVCSVSLTNWFLSRCRCRCRGSASNTCVCCTPFDW